VLAVLAAASIAFSAALSTSGATATMRRHRVYRLSAAAVARLRADLPPTLPAGWQPVSAGPAGGVVVAGNIPNPYVPDVRASAVYLPPGYSSARRYPVIYLLHGLPGSPSSFYDSLRIAQVSDGLITSGQAPPFIAVMPIGGPLVHRGSAEWAGVWASFVARAVVPWVDGHLSTIPTMQGRALAGLCAGGYGAVDIGLRHPGLFGTIESWQGYFAPVFRDGPFVHASPATLAANDPTLLVRHEAAILRRLGVRFYLSAGRNHGKVLRSFTTAFAALLGQLRLPHRLWLEPLSSRADFWRATLPSALVYAGAGFPRA
jgi:enterochelin esterase-like enzyme